MDAGAVMAEFEGIVDQGFGGKLGKTLGQLHIQGDNHWWLESHGDWRVAFRLAPEGMQPVVAEVRVFSALEEPRAPFWKAAPGRVPSGGVPASLLRGLTSRTPFTTLSAEQLKAVRKGLGIALADRLGITAKRRARSTEADRHRATVAAMYAAAAVRTAAVNSVVAQALGAGYNADHIRDVVSDARHKSGYLTEAPARGRPGGSLTPEGRAVLTDAEYEAAIKKVEHAIQQQERRKKR